MGPRFRGDDDPLWRLLHNAGDSAPNARRRLLRCARNDRGAWAGPGQSRQGVRLGAVRALRPSLTLPVSTSPALAGEVWFRRYHRHATGCGFTAPAAPHERTAPRRQPGPLLFRAPGGDRPRTRRRHRRRTAPPAGRHRADRQREPGLRRGAGGAGIGPDQQIRRGLSRPPLLRRLRLRGRGGTTRHRPGEDAVPMRLRQRAAAFRRAGQPGGVPRAAEAGRHHPGHEPRCRRPSDAWRRRRTCRASGSAPSSTACAATTGCWITSNWNTWRGRNSRS